MRMKTYFQASLDLEDRRCLVVGGGAEAAEKTGRLLDAAAVVTVVSPHTTPQLDAWAGEGAITLHRRPFLHSDLDGMHLVVNTVKSDRDLSDLIFRQCEARRILVGAYDQPHVSNFVYPSLVRRGRLRVAVSTGNTSPALASRLRGEFERLFDGEFVEFVEYLADHRQRLETSMPKGPERSTELRKLVRGLRIAGQVDYPPAFLAWREDRTVKVNGSDSTSCAH